MIELNGGKNLSSVSSKTNYLLAGDKMGPSKLKKAQDLGINIISEQDFNKLLNFNVFWVFLNNIIWKIEINFS